MTSGIARHDRRTAAEPSLRPARAAPPPRRIDDRLMSDFYTAVNALPWDGARRTHADLIESFVWLGWLRRDGNFIGLGEEGARIYASASRHD